MIDKTPSNDPDPLDALDVETRMNFASRLWALEYFACHLLSTMPTAFVGASDMDRMHRRMLTEVSGKHAAAEAEPHSELMMSELQYAIRRLISLQREILGMPRSPRRETATPRPPKFEP